MNPLSSNSGRRKFLTLVVGTFSAFFIGDRAFAAKKPPVKKIVKKPIQKTPTVTTPTKKVVTSTPSPKPSPNATGASPTPASSPTPNQTPTPSSNPVAPSALLKPVIVNTTQLKVDDLAVGSSVFGTYQRDGSPVSIIVAREDKKTFLGLKPICPHAGGPLEFSGNSLLCTWHLSRFNKITGDVEVGPAGSGLETEDIKIIEDKIFVVL